MFKTHSGDTVLKPEDLHLPKGDDFLSPEELKSLTAAKIIERTRALKLPLRDYAPKAEETRLPSPELWDALRKSGFFYMWVPKKYGGLEASVDEVIDAALPIAMGCASTGWIAMFGLVHNRHMANLPVKFQDEIFGGGKYVIQASGTMPPGKAVPVEGGYKVTGRWKWGTLATVSDWVSAIVVAETPEGPKPGACLIPTREVTIIDAWETDGMRATGTHDYECKDLFVPEHRCNFGAVRNAHGLGAKLYDNPIYRVPQSPLLAWTVLVPTVGAAKAAVELYKQRLEGHTKRGTDARQADKQASQIRLAKADTMVAAAEMLCRNVMKKNLEYADMQGDDTLPIRNRLRAQITYASMLCREAVIMVCEATGTSIHYLDNPLQRILRDTMVMTSHIIFDNDVVFEQHGRGMLGLPPNSVLV